MMLGGLIGGATLTFWGTRSDRYGRINVLKITIFAQLASTIGVILLATYPERLGRKWCALGIALDALFGGETATGVILTAYLSDCASSGSRSQMFSVYEAFYYAGLSLGPLLGSWAYSVTGLLLLPQYCMAAFLVLWLLCLLTIAPESLSVDQRRATRLKAEQESLERTKANSDQEIKWRNEGRIVAVMKLKRLANGPLELFRPLAVILPRTNNQASQIDPQDLPLLPVGESYKSERDWRLTLVALAFGLFMIVPGLINVKLVYARGKFGWGPVETGYWITFVAVCKLVGLLVLVPLATKWWKSRKVPQVAAVNEPQDVCVGDESLNAHRSYLKHLSDAKLDLNLARISIFATFVAYVVSSVPHPRNAVPYLVGTGIASLAAATAPALQSLALSLSSPRESGQTLAALAVLFNVCIQLIGPGLFGTVYYFVVDWWPEAVFAVAALWVLGSFVPLMLVKLGPSRPLLV
ncbi:hypothetical protein OIO90_000182 [Microbotryomycetes sp. JL221]|nr:hypothetical protein OIO90_000182 [Microbotryomycetes sp. JL221]